MINQSFAAEVGQQVRSYDFAGVMNCYVEGRVIGKGMLAFGNPAGHEMFEIQCTRRVWEGKEEECSDIVKVHFYTRFQTVFAI